MAEGAITVERLTDVQQFQALEPAWNTLLERNAGSSPQTTFPWLFTWWRWFGSSKELYLLVARQGGSCVGIAPLFLQRDEDQEGSPRTIHFLGEGLSDYAGFLCGSEDGEVTRTFWQYLFAHSDEWEEISLRELRDDGPDIAGDLADCAGWSFLVRSGPTVACPFLRITGDMAAYEQELSHNMRKNLRKAHDHALDEGLSLCFDVCTQVSPALLDEMEAIAAQRSQTDGHRSPFLIPQQRGFVWDALPLLAQQGLLRIFTARDGRRLVSYIICFSSHGILYDWISSYDPAYRTFSVTTLLREYLFKYVHTQGYRIFDFMRGQEPYKFEWVQELRWNRFLSIGKRGSQETT